MSRILLEDVDDRKEKQMNSSAFQMIQGLRVVVREVEGVRSDGSRFPLRISLASALNHGRLMLVGFLKDISEEKLQSQLAKQKEEVEIEKKKSEVCNSFLDVLRRDFHAFVHSFFSFLLRGGFPPFRSSSFGL